MRASPCRQRAGRPHRRPYRGGASLTTERPTPVQPAWRAQAGAAWRRGDGARVVAILRAAAAAEPQNIEPRAVLANYLVNAERLDEAIEALRACLALRPGDLVASHSLSTVLYDTGDFAGALAAAAVVPKGDGNYRRSLLIRLGCLEALGRAEAGAVAEEVLDLLADEPDWPSDDVSTFLWVMRLHARYDHLAAFCERWMERHGERPAPMLEVGRARFETGRVDDSLAVFHRAYRLGGGNMVAAMGRFPEAVPPLDGAKEADILRRFEAAGHGRGTGRVRPPEYGVQGPHPLRASTRMTFLGPATTNHGLPNDVMHHFVESARESGIDAEGYGDDVLFAPYGARVSDAEVAERRRRLHAFLEARPTDLVVLDCPFFPRPRTFNADDIHQVRAARPGVRVLHFFRDARDDIKPAFEVWRGAMDAFLVLDPRSFMHRLEAVRGRVLTIPQLAPRSRFFPLDGTPSIGISFVGATNFLLRIMMLAGAMKALPEMFVAAGAGRLDRVATMEDYAELLRQSRLTINISLHGERDRIITGRVWEAVLSGAVVLDQANDCTGYFFEPYRHFVPFADLPELVHVAGVLARHDDLRREIAASAIDWHRRHFDGARVWDSILQLAFADA